MNARALLQAANDSGLIKADELGALLDEARRTRRDAVELATTRLRVPKEALLRALAERRELPFVEADALTPDPELVKDVPLRLLERKRVLPLKRVPGGVLVACSDPDDAATLETVARLLGAPVQPAVASSSALEAALRRLRPESERGASAFDAVAFLDELMQQAYLRRASDVHLDPQDTGLSIRLRVDGRLQAYGPRLEPADATQLLTRIKVLGGLDIAERREPQDGGFQHTLEGAALDVRLATIPSRAGERATLRLLGVETRELTIDRLGFLPDELTRFRDVLEQPHGLVLLTGPTGSGKTTTLYAALREALTPEINVMTVEDPVEFAIDGITQIPVDRGGKVTFASALRSILRHDPDVIMVGEIRDPQTADVALKAALTGHLVLSSLHTNNAPSAVSRLADIGCERYLVASTLRAVIAQRLVRRLCERCRAPREASPEELGRLEGEAGASIFDPVGCAACVGTGYLGRLALTEALWVDAPLSAAIAAGAGEPELIEIAQAAGFRSLAQDGLCKVLAGETSLKEAARARI